LLTEVWANRVGRGKRRSLQTVKPSDEDITLISASEMDQINIIRTLKV
jgi:hypothetical protein